MSEQEKQKVILVKADIDRTLQRLTHQILEKNPGTSKIVLIGIQTRGVYIAKRIQSIIKEIKNIDIPVGILDITFYRDDLTAIGPKPVVKETKINFDLNGKAVVLIDDVFFTGRTVRAALDEIMDFGRPKKIECLVLIDRGHREMPIKAEFVGKNVPTSRDERVDVRIKEVDGQDEVIVIKR